MVFCNCVRYLGVAMKLFGQLKRGEIYTYGDKSERELVKMDGSHAVTPEGVRKTDPNVLVFERKGETEATRWKRCLQSRKK